MLSSKRAGLCSSTAEIGDELEGGGNVIELIVWLQLDHTAETARFAGNLTHRDAAADEREARKGLGAGAEIAVDVLGQPGLQEALDLIGCPKGADHVAALHLQMMREARGA